MTTASYPMSFILVLGFCFQRYNSNVSQKQYRQHIFCFLYLFYIFTLLKGYFQDRENNLPVPGVCARYDAVKIWKDSLVL